MGVGWLCLISLVFVLAVIVLFWRLVLAFRVCLVRLVAGFEVGFCCGLHYFVVFYCVALLVWRLVSVGLFDWLVNSVVVICSFIFGLILVV